MKKKAAVLKCVGSIMTTASLLMWCNAAAIIFSSPIFLQKKTAPVDNGTLLKYTDENPSSEKNYYRLKIFRGSTSYEATLPVMVITGNTEKGWVIYPVPVSTVLHLQYKGNDAIQGVISLNITCVNSGKVFNRMRVSSNNRIIDVPVDNLGNGVYDIRVYIGNEIVWNRRFVK